MIDNFYRVGNDILKFGKEGEFYMILVLRRRKDTKGTMPEDVNEDNRLIKHYFVYDREYFERKHQAIIDLCNQNNARAYILPQRRTCRQVLWALHDKVSATLKCGAMSVHFDHLIRTCIAGMHEVPSDAKWHKRWVIDIDSDNDEVIETISEWRGISKWEAKTDVECFADWIACALRQALVDRDGFWRGEVKDFMPNVKEIYMQSDICVLPTPHGFHIVTPPFNRNLAELANYLGGDFLKQGWIKPDAMALLYAPDSISRKEE